ncbi:MCP four helix bundle domain-containing protein [Bacillus mycoides]
MYEDSLLPIQWIGAIESNYYLINMNVKETILSKDEKKKNKRAFDRNRCSSYRN